VLPRSARFDDAVAALVHLGYTAAQAQETVREVSAEHDDPPLETLVRSALSRLGKAAAGVR
jgi:Holliday junction resolvasome RuvABC DNA-binding subunit